jgi:methyl-accepting chemotaxis protein
MRWSSASLVGSTGCGAPLIKTSGGFVNFLWPKLNKTVPSPKLNFSMTYPQWEWVISTGVYIDDVAATAATYRNMFLMLVGAAAAALISIAIVLGHSISRPIHRLLDNMGSLAQGDLSVVIGGTGCRDEIGHMAGSVQVFKDALIVKKSAENQAALEADAKARRAEALDQLTKRFEMNVSFLTQGLSAEATAQSMTSVANQTAHQSVAVSFAAH